MALKYEFPLHANIKMTLEVANYEPGDLKAVCGLDPVEEIKYIALAEMFAWFAKNHPELMEGSCEWIQVRKKEADAKVS